LELDGNVIAAINGNAIAFGVDGVTVPAAYNVTTTNPATAIRLEDFVITTAGQGEFPASIKTQTTVGNLQ
jgi:hypothetical protein